MRCISNTIEKSMTIEKDKVIPIKDVVEVTRFGTNICFAIKFNATKTIKQIMLILF